MHPERSYPPYSDYRWVRWTVGILAADLGGALLFAGAIGLMNVNAGGIPQIIGVPSMLLTPFASGLLASWIWHPLRPRLGASIHATFWMSLLLPLAAYIFLKEGIVCLLIGFPILFITQLVGVSLGRLWFKSDPSHLRLSLLVLLPLMIAGEPFAREDQTSIVTDHLRINATPAQVWPELTAFPVIKEEPAYWLFKIGLPYPVATTSAGDFVGASRECIFSGHAVFKETVVSIDRDKQLTFSIDELPPDPELIGTSLLPKANSS